MKSGTHQRVAHRSPTGTTSPSTVRPPFKPPVINVAALGEEDKVSTGEKKKVQKDVEMSAEIDEELIYPEQLNEHSGDVDDMQKKIDEIDRRWNMWDAHHGIGEAELGRKFSTVTDVEMPSAEEVDRHNITHIPLSLIHI